MIGLDRIQASCTRFDNPTSMGYSTAYTAVQQGATTTKQPSRAKAAGA